MSDVTVPLLDLKAQYASLRDEIEPVIRKVVEDQWFIMGPEVQALENECAEYLGVKHAIGCASGSDAILLACMALDIGCGGGHNGRVLCPSYTFFSTAGSVWRLGAMPVFADIDPTTYNLNIDHAREVAKSTEKLAALMPVHLFGQAVDMDAWLALGEELGVPVIEDAAQAIGTRDSTGAMVGTRGKIGCFSFFPSKNLGGFGDGGLVTTNDDDLADRLRLLRLHGSRPKYYHSIVGLNSRLDAMQAAVLRIKLRHLESWHQGRRANADFYDHGFTEAGAKPSGTPFEQGEALPLRTPTPAAAPARHIYNQYVIRVPEPLRDDLREHLKNRNIGSEIYYPVPLHIQECFEHLGGKEGDLPESEAAAKETVALPIYPELTTEQKNHVITEVVAFLKSKAGGVIESKASGGTVTA
ncbi:MAG: DegT/DnrJ/EryC1/StrS family aminotransferase [Planctomycetota bacterium]